jgi:hypothetical protein
MAKQQKKTDIRVSIFYVNNGAYEAGCSGASRCKVKHVCGSVEQGSRSLSSIDDRTPYDLFVLIFGKDTADKLGIKKITTKELCSVWP